MTSTTHCVRPGECPGQEFVRNEKSPSIVEGHESRERACFIAVVLLCGMTVMTYSVLHGRSANPLKFFCYVVIALAASRLKVNLPGITGTMSVNFLFLLLGVLELSLPETMAMGCAAVVVQCLDRESPNPIQVAFNICSTALAIAVTFSPIAIPCCTAPSITRPRRYSWHRPFTLSPIHFRWPPSSR
jgi:predicted membrane channel-forming protein YqfA (hemolysin III family)